MHFISDISTLYQVEPGPEFRLVDSNARAQLLGSGPKSFYGKLIRDFIPPDYYERHILLRYVQAMELKRPVEYSDASPFSAIKEGMEFRITPILNEDGDCTHIWVISRYRQKHDDLEYLAFHDTLTGVPNRLAFTQRLQKAISRHKQHKIRFAVMIIDCDNFKWVNDNFGHDAGDLLLRELAGQIGSCLRQQDMIARFGGDEFAVLLEDCDHGPTAEEYAREIIKRATRSWEIKGQPVRTTISIGITYSTDSNVDEILSVADKALYSVKSRGRDSYAVIEDDRKLPEKPAE